MKRPTLQDVFQDASKQVLKLETQVLTSGTGASAVLLPSPDVSYDISSNG
jgi:hypothetical protein